MRRTFPFLTSILLGLFLLPARALMPGWSTALGASVVRAQSGQPQASPQPVKDSGVFVYEDRNGRKVYTNLEGSAAHGKAGLVKLDLPPLSSVDFEHTGPEGLRALDQRVTESHNALQSGLQCDAIRKSSRTPTWARLWTDHNRKISTAALLLVFGAVLGLLGTGRRLGALFPVLPILGCAFLGYATYRDSQKTRETLTAGLRACSEQLPEGDPVDKQSVQGRLAKALDVQRIVHGAFERQAAEIERALNER